MSDLPLAPDSPVAPEEVSSEAVCEGRLILPATKVSRANAAAVPRAPDEAYTEAAHRHCSEDRTARAALVDCGGTTGNFAVTRPRVSEWDDGPRGGRPWVAAVGPYGWRRTDLWWGGGRCPEADGGATGCRDVARGVVTEVARRSAGDEPVRLEWGPSLFVRAPAPVCAQRSGEATGLLSKADEDENAVGPRPPVSCEPVDCTSGDAGGDALEREAAGPVVELPNAAPLRRTAPAADACWAIAKARSLASARKRWARPSSSSLPSLALSTLPSLSSLPAPLLLLVLSSRWRCSVSLPTRGPLWAEDAKGL